MSDKNESPKDIDTSKTEDAMVIKSSITQSSQATQTMPDNGKKPKTAVLWFFTLLNLIILILVCAGAYWYYIQLNQDKSSESSAIVSVQQNLKDLAVEQSKLQNEIATKLGNVNGDQNDLKQAVSELRRVSQENTATSNAAAQRLAEMSGRRPSDWLLAEANYLVNMAGRKVYLEKDVSTAMTLLTEADQRLNDLNDPSLFPVRALISADIQALQQVNPVSTSAVAMTIAGMIPQVSELPINSLKLPETQSDEDLALSEDLSDWQANLNKTWKAIVGDFISIKAVDTPLEPYLAERQQWLIEQQIKHALAQAQTAVLNEQQALFRAVIGQAIVGLNEHYRLDDTSVAQYIEALQKLQNTDFEKNLPNVLASQASLKDIVEQRIQRLFNNIPRQQQASDAESSEDSEEDAAQSTPNQQGTQL